MEYVLLRDLPEKGAVALELSEGTHVTQLRPPEAVLKRPI